jgi:SOS response regulatory protein OraA/RecX
MSDTKMCPYCGEDIKIEAIKCKHCHSMLSKEDDELVGVATRPTEKIIKKPLWQQWWPWVAAFIVLFIVLIASSGNNTSTSRTTGTETVEDSVEEELPEWLTLESSSTEGKEAKEPEPQMTDEEAPKTTDTSPEVKDSVTMGEKNAAAKALDYLAYTSFSYSGLVEQLKYEGFKHEEAVYGVNQCGANWNEQAALKALDYLAYTAFSYSGLVEQLKFEGFTHAEAVYGVDKCGANWNEQAALKAQDYIDYSSFSRAGLIAQLEFEGFTRQQAEYGVQAVGY